MTREAVAAIEGARQAGATEFVVADAHGNMQNLLIDQFPADVRIVRGEPRHLSMMAGIDATFDAAMYIGYHASTTNPNGVRAHTFSSARITRVAINGNPVTEGAWNAAIAGHFGVPVVFIAGDDAAIAEVRAAIGNIEAAETKRALGFHAAETITPEASQKRKGRCPAPPTAKEHFQRGGADATRFARVPQKLIREKAAAAIRRLAQQKPYRVTGPVTVDISFKSVMPSSVAAYLERVFTRTDSHTIRFTAKDMVESSDIVEFLMAYRIELEP